MFDYLAASYKDSDYTFVNTLACRPKHEFDAETYLGECLYLPIRSLA